MYSYIVSLDLDTKVSFEGILNDNDNCVQVQSRRKWFQDQEFPSPGKFGMAIFSSDLPAVPFIDVFFFLLHETRQLTERNLHGWHRPGGLSGPRYTADERPGRRARKRLSRYRTTEVNQRSTAIGQTCFACRGMEKNRKLKLNTNF